MQRDTGFIVNQEDLISSAQTKDQKAPGRTVGFTLMILIIVFVSIWMKIQGNRDEAGLDVQLYSEDIEGFNRGAWHLPNDMLWGFVEVPAGDFIMGSNPTLDRSAYENERWSDLERQGRVFLPTYYVSRFETTIAQFSIFAQEFGLDLEQINLEESSQFPVYNVTWPDALAYARWLDSKLRNSPNTPNVIKSFLNEGGRVTIPSEAEWEKAARGNDGRIFPWGSQPTSDFANFNANGVRAVGAEICDLCAYGLSDMAGNVWELTRSPLQSYPYDLSDDEDNLSEDALWVMRGGSYADSINNIRTATRGAVDPGVRNDAIGFRIAISRH